MPTIRFVNLPRPLWEHILERVAERAITLEDLQRLRSWVVTEPQAPDGDWYKGLRLLRALWYGRVPEDGPQGAMVFEVSPADPGLFALAAAVLVVAGLAAGWLPARRAARVDPMAALRCE